jgi:hypothetical protein
VMKVGRYVVVVAAAAALVATLPARALAHGDEHSDHGKAPAPLVKAVRDATAQFLDVRVAENSGYHLLFGCVSGPDAGAMGMHFVNADLIGDDVIDVTRPEIVIYEPIGNGRVRLIGADFLVLKDVWDQSHPGQGAPQLMGQIFHLFEAPNRFGLPDFYTLHVWAWKDSPTGTFVNWNQNVSCDAFAGGSTR